MSSHPQHVENLKLLEELGFDVSEYTEDTMESWHYDELVYLIADIITQLKTTSEPNLATLLKNSRIGRNI